jgi:hypothetical protein
LTTVDHGVLPFLAASAECRRRSVIESVEERV